MESKIFTILISVNLDLLEILPFLSDNHEKLITEAFAFTSQEQKSLFIHEEINQKECNRENYSRNIRIALSEKIFKELSVLSQKENKYINFIAGKKLSDYIVHKIMTVHDYIQIDSIDEIDTTKIPVSQLNQFRYIDKDNNKYTLRFNLKSRKVEIHRIVTKDEVHIVSRKIYEEKISALEKPIIKEGQNHFSTSKRSKDLLIKSVPDLNKQIPPGNSPPKKDIASNPKEKINDSLLFFNDIDLNIMEELPQQNKSDEIIQINETDFIKTTIEKIIKTKERVIYLLNNLNGSKVYEILGIDKNILTDISREFDHEVYQEIENCEKYYKELTEYPRPISYYIVKYEKTKLHVLDNLLSDEKKMDSLIRWEMEELFSTILRKLKSKLGSLLMIINQKNENFLSQLTYNQKRMFNDAKNAAVLCMTETDTLIKQYKEWENILK